MVAFERFIGFSKICFCIFDSIPPITLPSSTARSSRHAFLVRGLPSQIPSPSSRRLRTYINRNRLMSADLQADRSLLPPSVAVSLAKAALPVREGGSELLLAGFPIWVVVLKSFTVFAILQHFLLSSH